MGKDLDKFFRIMADISKIKIWWDAERIGRPEEGTSQDFCLTNGQ